MPQKPKKVVYRVKIADKLILKTSDLSEVQKYIEKYTEKNVEIDSDNIREMLSNIFAGEHLFKGIDLDTKPLIKVFENRKMLESISERDVCIDHFIKFIASAELDNQIEVPILPVVKMNLQMISTAYPLLEGIINYNVFRQITLASVVGILKSAFDGDLSMHVIEGKTQKKKADENVIYG